MEHRSISSNSAADVAGPAQQLGALDRAIGRLFPGWGAKRERARLEMVGLSDARALLERQRAFAAAAYTARTSGWRAPSTGPDTENGPALERLRNRSRDLVRDDAWASKAVRVVTASCVGTGILPRARLDNRAQRKDIAKRWDDWFGTKTCSHDGRRNGYGIQRIAQRSTCEAGEVLLRRRWVQGASKGVVPVRVQVLEPDHLDTSRDGQLTSGNVVIQGVEHDPTGVRVAYWLWPDHPGEMGIAFRRRFESERVPARDIIHLLREERPGQTRGIPWGTPCLIRLRDQAEYVDATILRQKLANCFGVFIRDHNPEASLPGASAAAGPIPERVTPAMIVRLPPGLDATIANPPQVEGFDEFTSVTLRSIAMGYGVSYEELTGDLRKTNYSSARIGMLQLWEERDQWQWLELIPLLCEGLWDWFLDGLELVDVPIDRATTAIWYPPRRRRYDLQAEVSAEQDEVRAGFKLRSEAIAGRGEDPDDVLERYAEEQKRLDELGLELDSDPRRPVRTGTKEEPAKPAGKAGEDPEDGGKTPSAEEVA